MLSLLEISPRPTWSVFIITQNLKFILSKTKDIGNLIQLSKTFMFIPKANSKQKHVKKTQERETGDVVTVQLASRVKSLAMASNDRLLS